MIGPSISRNNPQQLVQFPMCYGAEGWSKGQPRHFKIEFDSDELSNLKFILENLATKKLPKLFVMRKELGKRGERLDHLHPLAFLLAALNHDSNPYFYQLKKKGGKAWEEFVKGCVESFHEESRHGNITTQQIEVFSQLTNKPFHQVQAYLNSHSYYHFINWL